MKQSMGIDGLNETLACGGFIFDDQHGIAVKRGGDMAGKVKEDMSRS